MSVVCLHFQRLLHRPISFKFHMQPFSKGEKKVYIFRPGHMAKMAAIPIHGQNFKIIFFSRTTGPIGLH